MSGRVHIPVGAPEPKGPIRGAVGRDRHRLQGIGDVHDLEPALRVRHVRVSSIHPDPLGEMSGGERRDKRGVLGIGYVGDLKSLHERRDVRVAPIHKDPVGISGRRTPSHQAGMRPGDIHDAEARAASGDVEISVLQEEAERPAGGRAGVHEDRMARIGYVHHLKIPGPRGHVYATVSRSDVVGVVQGLKDRDRLRHDGVGHLHDRDAGSAACGVRVVPIRAYAVDLVGCLVSPEQGRTGQIG